MNILKTITLLISSAFLVSACGNNDEGFDASGSFEAEETIIPAEVAGVINELNIEEGEELQAGDTIGYIDSVQLHLKKKQLLAQINAIISKKPNVSVQVAALEEQLKNAEQEKSRISKLAAGNAATTKQLDDIQTNIEVIKKQIQAQRSALEISNSGINNDAAQFRVQVEQIEDQLSKCFIISPINGTVLAKYVEANEMAAPGKALYKIADLSNIILRTYISGDQLPQVKINQTVTVSTDDGEGGFKEAQGTITWINDKAEFTPKTIQTKDERANMVYAVKISVVNDGSYKIGMYGEIKFQ